MSLSMRPLSVVLASMTMMTGAWCAEVLAPRAVDAAVDASRVGVQVRWTFGGGSTNVVRIAESRAGILYAAVVVSADDSSTRTGRIVALDPSGRELWRLDLADANVWGLMSRGDGDIWVASPAAVTRIAASGALRWRVPMAGLPWPSALGPDGTSYFYYTLLNNPHVFLRALAPDGSIKWSAPLGGNTNGFDGAHRTIFDAPAIGPSGRIYVPCLRCPSGQSGVVGLDPITGDVVAQAAVGPADAGVQPNTVQGVTIDDAGNIYFGFGRGFAAAPMLASAMPTGSVRWTTGAPRAPESAAGVPGLVGPDGLVANGPGGFVEISPDDGGVRLQTSAAGEGRLMALVDPSLRLTEMTFEQDASASLPTHTLGTALVDRGGRVVWSDRTMSAGTAIPGPGLVYGIEMDAGTGVGTLVAMTAPTTGRQAGAWPMTGHDPGRTSSAAGSW